MRALNEGDVSIGTIVRLEDRSLTQVRASGARITIGAGVTLSQILRERELSFLHAPARLIGGPAVRTTATVGGNLFAPAPYGDLAVALLALDATVSVMSGYGARDMALEEFLASRDRTPGALVLERHLRPAVECRGVSLPEGGAREAQGRFCAFDCCLSPGGRRTRLGSAHRLWRDGADGHSSEGRGTGA